MLQLHKNNSKVYWRLITNGFQQIKIEPELVDAFKNLDKKNIYLKELYLPHNFNMKKNMMSQALLMFSMNNTPTFRSKI